MADKKPTHFLRQRWSDRIYTPEPELVHREDMEHIMGYFEDDGTFVKTGMFEGNILTEEERDPMTMGKKDLKKYLIEELGVAPSNVEGLKVVELRDMVFEIRQSNEELGG